MGQRMDEEFQTCNRLNMSDVLYTICSKLHVNEANRIVPEGERYVDQQCEARSHGFLSDRFRFQELCHERLLSSSAALPSVAESAAAMYRAFTAFRSQGAAAWLWALLD